MGLDTTHVMNLTYVTNLCRTILVQTSEVGIVLGCWRVLFHAPGIVENS
jgi:hypothetical protein